VVCPSVNASDTAIRNVLGIISATNAEAFFADPVEHDSYVAGISHLPFLMAATLMDTVTQDQSWRDMSSLASSGFRDTTRLALGDPQMHRDILMTNKTAVIRWIDQLQANLSGRAICWRGTMSKRAQSCWCFSSGRRTSEPKRRSLRPGRLNKRWPTVWNQAPWETR
jgi:hypothetical protein